MNTVTNGTNEKAQVYQAEETQVYQVQFCPPRVILFLSNLPLLLHFACLYIYYYYTHKILGLSLSWNDQQFLLRQYKITKDAQD